MRTWLFLLALALISLNESTQASWSLHGRVLDASDRPVGMARVLAVDARGNALASSVSSSTGAFSLIGMATAEGTVWATVAGFAPGFAVISPNAEAEIRLSPQRRVLGSVVGNITSISIAGATVTATLKDHRAMLHDARIARSPFLPTTTTDKQGRFTLGGLYAGEKYVLTASAEGFVFARADADAAPLRIVLSRGAAVAGTVVEATPARPVVGATVELTGLRAERRQAVSDASGEYRFTSLDSDAVDVRAYRDHTFTWKPARHVRLRAGQETRIPPLRLEPGWMARVDVRDTTGRPIRRAGIFYQQNIPWLPYMTAVEDSHAILGPLPPWQESLVVEATGYLAQRVEIPPSILPAATEVLTATLTPAPRVYGRIVTCSGEPLPGARISYDIYNVNRLVGTKDFVVIADATGCFTVYPDYTSGHVGVDADMPGYARTHQWLFLGRSDIQDVTLYRGGWLRGRVRTADGAAVSSATVTVQIPTDNPRRFHADADGLWRSAPIPEGTQTLTADSVGLFSDPVQVFVADGKETLAPDLILKPGLRFEGTVVEEGSEEPIPGIRVGLGSSGGYPRRMAVSATTDDKGHFDVRGVRAGTFVCLVEDPRPPEERKQVFKNSRYGSGYGSIKFADTDLLNYRITGRAAFRVEGTVVDAETEVPIPNARISADPYNAMTQDDYEYRSEATSDEEGNFNLMASALGARYTINASLSNSDYASARQEVAAPAEGDVLSGVILRLARAARLAGKVVSSTGEPQPNVPVFFVWSAPDEKSGQRGYQEKTDAQGHFDHKGSDPGRYRITASRKGDSYSWQPGPNTLEVTVAPGESRTDLVLSIDSDTPVPKAKGYLAGTVVDAQNKPVADVRVSIDCREDRQGMEDYNLRRGEARSDKNGKYRIDNVRAGRFQVSASYKSADFDAGTVILPKDDFVIKVQATGGIAGRVEGGYGEKITQFRLRARPDQPNMAVDSDNLSSSQLQSDANGAFKIENLAPGTYRLMVVAEGYAPRVSEPIEVKPGEITKNVVIHLSGGGNVEVHVADPAGQAVQGAFIFTGEEAQRLADSNRSWPKSWTRQTDKGGLYTFKWQAEGKRMAVAAYHPDYAEGWGEVAVAAGKTQRLEIALAPAGAVQGTVYDRTGQPKPGVAMQAYANLPPLGHRNWGNTTDNAGHYQFRSLAPGRWQINANFTPGGPRYSGQSQSVELTAGQTMTVDFREASGRIFGVATRAGTPAAGVDVSVYASSSGGQVTSNASAKTNAQGQYECLGLAPGKYTVAAYVRTPSGGRSSPSILQHVELAVGESREVNLDIPTGVVRGVVVRDSDGTAVGGARVSAQRPPSAESSTFAWYGGDAQTDGDGKFELLGLGAGKYHLSAREGSGGTSTAGAVDVELADGQVLEDVKITLGSGGTIEGTITIAGQTGPLSQDVQLMAMPRDGSVGIDPYGSRISVDRTTGAYKSSGFPAGEYTVLAVVPRGALGLQLKPVSVRKGETSRLDFVLGPGVRLRFHISDAAGGTPQTVGFGCATAAGLSLMPGAIPKMSVADLERLYQEIAFSREAYRFTFTADGYKTAVVDVDLSGYTEPEKDVPVVMEKE